MTISLDGASTAATKDMHRVKFMRMDFTDAEFEQLWAMIEEADFITPWPSEETFEDIYRVVRDSWRPYKPGHEILADVEAWLIEHGLR